MRIWNLKHYYGEKFYNSINHKYELLIKKIYGDDKTLWVQIIPHEKHLLILKFDKNLNSHAIEDVFKSQKGQVITAPNDGCWWIPIISQTSKESNCFTETHTRQLKAIGYQPLVVRKLICKFKNLLH